MAIPSHRAFAIPYRRATHVVLGAHLRWRLDGARRRLAAVTSGMRRIIGVPDYERYLRHMQLVHPTHSPLERDAFTRDALARRYERPGARCC